MIILKQNALIDIIKCFLMNYNFSYIGNFQFIL